MTIDIIPYDNGHFPKVSVYISTCNRLDKLKRAISSVKNQDYQNIEIIVCDDASTDGTRDFMQSLVETDTNIVYLRNEENKGACATRNLGIFSATGVFITGLDDDDEFAENRISTFIKNWDEKYSFLCANFLNVYKEGDSKDNYLNNNELSVFNYESLLFENTASNQIFTLTARLREIGGFDVRARRLQDWDTWLRLSYKFGQFLRLPESSYYMYHDHNLDEKRVSKSFSFLDALNEMRVRNQEIYGEKNSLILKYLIAYHKRKLTLTNSINWFYISKNPKHLVKYFYQYLVKREYD